MKTYTNVRHEVDNALLSLSGESLTVTDSKSQDSVTIGGFTRKQIARELRYWVSSCEWSHYESTRDKEEVTLQLQKLQETLTSTLEKLTPKAEETV